MMLIIIEFEDDRFGCYILCACSTKKKHHLTNQTEQNKTKPETEPDKLAGKKEKRQETKKQDEEKQ